MSTENEKNPRREAGSVYEKRQRKEAERKKELRKGRLYALAFCLIGVLALALAVWNSKLIQRNAPALKVGSETYTAGDVSYFFWNIYSNAMTDESDTSYIRYRIDTSKSLRSQDSGYGGTWYDYFENIAVSSLSAYALRAQQAKASGFEAAAEEDAAVAEATAALKATAEAGGYTSAGYLKSLYRSMVTQKTLERNIRMCALADAYTQSFRNTVTVTDEQIAQEGRDNADLYSYVDFEYAAFSTSADSADTSAASVESAKASADMLLERYRTSGSFEAVTEDLGGYYQHVKYGRYATYYSSDPGAWLFDDARKDGDTSVEPLADGTGYYVILFHGKHLSDFHPVSVRHILVSDEERAKTLLQSFESGDRTETSFAALATANSIDSGSSADGGLYANLYLGDTVEPFENWCFDPARKPGDTGIVQTDYGYHVMYFVETNERLAWQIGAQTTLEMNAYNDWLATFSSGVEPAKLSGMRYVG